MPQKICPLSFFNFYINKEAAQAGGCHLCVEESCALWDENYQQCSLKSGIEAIGAVADAISTDLTEDSFVNKSTSPISSVLEKLRMRKRVEAAKPVNPPPPPPAPVTFATAATSSNISANPSPLSNFDIQTPIPSPQVEDHAELINRPQVPLSELPVISLNTPKEDDLKL